MPDQPFKIQQSSQASQDNADRVYLVQSTDTAGPVQNIGIGATATLTGFTKLVSKSGSISHAAGLFTLPEDGLYQISVAVSCTIDTATPRHVWIAKTGDNTQYGKQTAVGGAAVAPFLSTSVVVPFFGAAARTFNVRVQNNAAAAIDVPASLAAANVSVITIVKIA